MEETKPGLNWKRILITFVIVLLTAGAVGGTTYYVLNSNFQGERNSLVSELDVAKKEAVSAKTTAAVPTSTTTTAPAAVKDTVEDLRTFCVGGNSDTEVGGLTYMESVNGVFGNCGISSKSQPGGGGMLIAKKINNVWTKLWAGNGVISDTLCDQYKIPNKMSGGTCNY